MPARVPWRSLVPGLIAFAVIIAVAMGVLVFAGVGKIRGEKTRLYVQTSQARGVLRGTEVWLAGQKIGMVDDVEFLPPTADTSARVLLAIHVRAGDSPRIRRDSHVQIRPGANFLGPMVIYITGGTPGSPALTGGDTLRAGAELGVESAGARRDAATRELAPLMTDARAVIAHTRNPNGTIGAFLRHRTGSGLRGELAELRAQVARVRQLTSGDGTAPGPRAVLASARSAMARADSIMSLLNSSSTSLGRFRRDSTLAIAVADVRDELATLRSRLAASEGTLGRIQSDSALVRAITDAQNGMTVLFDDMRRRPRRYITF